MTAEVADVESRVTSARRVIETFRSRLDQATTITDILALETEIARREAELEALEARKRALDDSVDLSTVTVTFTATEEVVLPADDNLGFLPGLQAGWRGLQSATAVALTIIGGLLPFTVLTLLIAVPLWLLLAAVTPRGLPQSGDGDLVRFAPEGDQGRRQNQEPACRRGPRSGHDAGGRVLLGLGEHRP